MSQRHKTLFNLRCDRLAERLYERTYGQLNPTQKDDVRQLAYVPTPTNECRAAWLGMAKRLMRHALN